MENQNVHRKQKVSMQAHKTIVSCDLFFTQMRQNLTNIFFKKQLFRDFACFLPASYGTTARGRLFMSVHVSLCFI